MDMDGGREGSLTTVFGRVVRRVLPFFPSAILFLLSHSSSYSHPCSPPSHTSPIPSPYPYSRIIMPAVRNAQLGFAATGITKAPPGWTKDQKSMLFTHVIKFGEKDWGVAVPGKTSKEVSHRLSDAMFTRLTTVLGAVEVSRPALMPC
jgi:hypothetical protein